MNRTKHQLVISALEKRVLRYHNGNLVQQNQDEILYNGVVDEIGTVSTASLADSDSESVVTWAEFFKLGDKGCVIICWRFMGWCQHISRKGATRLIYGNGNRFNSRISNNVKFNKAEQVMDDLDPGIGANNEHNLNLKHKENKNGFSQMFNGGDCEIR